MTEPRDTLLHNLEAEKAVLGACLIRQAAVGEVAGTLGADDFFRQAHTAIWRAIRRLDDAGRTVDLLIIRDELARVELIDAVGGPAYVASLTDGVPRSTNVRAYAAIVVELAGKRRLKRALDRGSSMRELSALIERVPDGPEGHTADDRVWDLFSAWKKSSDDTPPAVLVEGIAWEGRVTLLHARAGCGKSTLLAHAAAQVTRDGGAVIWIGADDPSVRTRHVQFGGDAEKFYYTSAAEVVALGDVKAIGEVVKPRLIVIDTATEYISASGGDINHAGNVDLALRPWATAARAASGGHAVVILHHQGWSEARSRNSSAFVDLCDVSLGMSRIENTVTLKADKIRFQLEDVFPIHFELCGEGYTRRDTPPVASEDDQGGLEHGWSDDDELAARGWLMANPGATWSAFRKGVPVRKRHKTLRKLFAVVSGAVPPVPSPVPGTAGTGEKVEAKAVPEDTVLFRGQTAENLNDLPCSACSQPYKIGSGNSPNGNSPGSGASNCPRCFGTGDLASGEPCDHGGEVSSMNEPISVEQRIAIEQTFVSDLPLLLAHFDGPLPSSPAQLADVLARELLGAGVGWPALKRRAEAVRPECWQSATYAAQGLIELHGGQS